MPTSDHHATSGGAGHTHDVDRHDEHDAGRDEHGRGAHEHSHPQGRLGRFKELFAPHSHDAAVAVDNQLETSRKGIRALIVSFAALAVTALLQGLVVWRSGSVALLGDTLHNLSDAFTAIPLAVAFTLGRRAATRRYTYGYGRAEDLAGIAIIVFIAASAALAGYQAIERLLDPQEVRALGLVAAAAVVGFAGNELVARYRIRVGREIGSAALVADGLHARTDALTSLSVLLGAGGAALGFRLADPLVGLGITAAILVVLRDAAREVYRRLMDAVDPALVDQVEAALRATPGVLALGQVRVRWIGHALRAECEIDVGPELSVVDGHRVAEDAQHRLLHNVPRLTAALVHADPAERGSANHHQLTAHHLTDAPTPRRSDSGDQPAEQGDST